MKDFNLFEPILEQGVKFGRRGRYVALAKKGDPKEFWYDFSKLNRERKSESDNMTKMEVLIYDTTTKSLDWKSVYRNTKGVYFKKHREKFYIKN